MRFKIKQPVLLSLILILNFNIQSADWKNKLSLIGTVIGVSKLLYGCYLIELSIKHKREDSIDWGHTNLIGLEYATQGAYVAYISLVFHKVFVKNKI